jgi:ADP-glucose pyrophosphorylase
MMNGVLAYKFNDYWRDISTAAAFYKASMEVVSQ